MRLTWLVLRRQWSVIDSGGVGVRRQPDPDDVRRAAGCRQSISPGPWWENPLWSLRQQVEVSSTLSEDTGARHGSFCACWSHLTCWTAIDADTMANASYVANTPCRPLRR